MADEPVIISGGSLKVKAKGKFKEAGLDDKGNIIFEYGKGGNITSVEIDGKPYSAHAGSEIIIHYDVTTS